MRINLVAQYDDLKLVRNNESIMIYGKLLQALEV